MFINFALIFTTSFVLSRIIFAKNGDAKKPSEAALGDIQETMEKVDFEADKSNAAMERNGGIPGLGFGSSIQPIKSPDVGDKLPSGPLSKPQLPELEEASPCDLCAWVYKTVQYYVNSVIVKVKLAVDKVLQPLKPMIDMVLNFLAKLWKCAMVTIKKILSLAADIKNKVPGFSSNGTVAAGDCGVQASQYRPSLTHRILNGREAKKHSWPWQLDLHFLESEEACGGSILRVSDKLEESDVVLTAAHCVIEKERVYNLAKCRAGLHDKDGPADDRVQTQRSHTSIPHPDYNSKTNDNDIALLFLKEPFKFTDEVQPICLPKQGEEIPVEKQCVVTGWGIYKPNSKDTPAKLQQLSVPVRKPDACRQYTFIEEHMICAGDLKGDACLGDSGGPLQCKRDDGKWVEYGIVSVGSDCNKLTSPGYYAKVSAYVDWINKMIREHSRLI